MKNSSGVHGVLLVLIAISTLFLTGCVSYELPGRAFGATLGQDGVYRGENGKKVAVTQFVVVTENTTEHVVEVFWRGKVVAEIPPHEVKNIFAVLNYYERNQEYVFEARPVGVDMTGKQFAVGRFFFQNYDFDPVFGQGQARQETRYWKLTNDSFILRQNGRFFDFR